MRRTAMLALLLVLVVLGLVGGRTRTVYRPVTRQQQVLLSRYTRTYARYRAEVRAYWAAQDERDCVRLLLQLRVAGLVHRCEDQERT